MQPETAHVEHPLLDTDPVDRDRGFALVVVAALLAMLGALSTLFLAQTRAAWSQKEGGAEIAAESGLEYAAARLREKAGYPLCPRIPENRADDWAFRDDPAVPVERAQNPSWARGEGTPGAGSWTDLDGDGRFSAWSGRLRGCHGPFAERFSLKIESCGAKIPVNLRPLRGGALLDRTTCRYLLNSLGAQVLPSGHPRRLRLATSNPATFVESSLLGDDIFGNTPVDGLQGANGLIAAMARARDADGLPAYPPGPDGNPWGLREILPFITFAPAPILSPQTEIPVPLVTDGTLAPTIELTTAPIPVLKALWRYASHPPATSSWRAPAAQQVDPKSGMRFMQSNVILYPEDVDALVPLVLSLRDASLAGGPPLWLGDLRRTLLMNAPVLFPPPASLAPFPVEAARWCQSKADLAFLCVTPDAPPHFAAPPETLHTEGVERLERIGGTTLSRRGPDVSWLQIARTPIPSSGYSPLTVPFSGRQGNPAVRPLCTTRPSILYDVASSAAHDGGGLSRTTRQAMIETHAALFFGAQHDLEGVYSPRQLSALRQLGIVPDNDLLPSPVPPYRDTGRRQIEDDGRAYRRLASLPSWDHRSYPAGAMPPFEKYSPFFGALVLAGLEAGTREASLYWPFSEAPPGLPQAFLSESGETPPFPSIAWMGMTPPPPAAVPLNPGIGTLHTHDQALFTPHQVSGGVTNTSGMWSPPLEQFPGGLSLPGIAGSPNMSGAIPFDYFVIEGWAALCVPPSQPQDVFVIRLFDRLPVGGEIQVGVLQVRLQGVAANPFSSPSPVFRFTGSWASLGGALPEFDIPLPEETAWTTPHFCRLTVKFDRMLNRTTFELRVDDHIAGQAMNGRPNRAMTGKLTITGVDDLRIYDEEPPMHSYELARDAGRFTRRGNYSSPLYRFDRSRTLRRVQWTGAVPPGFPSGSLSVSLTGYDPSGAIAGPIDLGPPGSVSDPSAWGRIAAFRYEVSFNVPASVPQPLSDTPVFESIDLVLDPPSGHPGWLRYE